MKRLLVALSLIITICLTFTGCDLDIEDETVSVSGDLTYYAAMDEDTIKEKCEGNLIEVSGTVSTVYSNIGTIHLGNSFSDGIAFSCSLSDSDGAKNIENGDLITIHGKCNSCIGSTIYLSNCEILSHTKESELESTSNTTTTDSITDTSTTPSSESTEKSTVPSNSQSSHIHNFSSATCTAPKTCSCGTTEGRAKGHTWTSATCNSPKICSSCNATEGSIGEHSWKDATYTSPKTCTVCGATEGNSLDVPGKENYHGHVYTGGDSSTKYHYESNCAGKYSHEITWDDVERRGLDPCGTCVLK